MTKEQALSTLSQPQPAPPPYYSPPPLPHSHDQYLAAIVAVALIALIVGGIVGYGLSNTPKSLGTSPQPQAPAQFTFVHGTADSPSGTPLVIYFDNQETGTLTSAVFPSITRNGVTTTGHFYQVYLVSGKTYTMTIYYDTALSGIQHCAGRPGVFTPSGPDYTQDFLC